MGRARATASLLLVLIACSAVPASAGAAVDVGVQQFGRSAEGRPIRVARRCAPGASVDVLVVGSIHGNETAGTPVVGRLARSAPPVGTCLWLLASLNPDGVVERTRQNARGVDLNRNFPFRWRGGGRSFATFFPGRARASEPETRAAMRMVRAIEPDVTVWYHQHANMTIRPPLPWRVRLARAYARTSRLPMRTYTIGGPLHGTASSWQHAEQPASLALVVELPAGSLGANALRRHVAAVRTVTRLARDRAR